jgi:hypothetical protein
VVEHLSSKHEALTSNPRTAKKRRERERQRERNKRKVRMGFQKGHVWSHSFHVQ